MRVAAESLATGEPGAKAAVVQNALAYVALLKQHIDKEETVLFPMAGRVIELRRQSELAEAFERIEHEETGEGVHEKYLAMAERLEREARP
jgi:hemerythrin-like domain-containing protein